MITCCFRLELHHWILLPHALGRVSFWLETLQLTERQRNTFLSEVLHVEKKSIWAHLVSFMGMRASDTA